jgi:hypothetical protein
MTDPPETNRRTGVPSSGAEEIVAWIRVHHSARRPRAVRPMGSTKGATKTQRQRLSESLGDSLEPPAAEIKLILFPRVDSTSC